MKNLRREDNRHRELFRMVMVALLLGQMFVYYDTLPKTIPSINLYLLINLLLITLTFVPSPFCTMFVWWAVWPVGILLRWGWAIRPTRSDVFWATSQGVYFLLHGMNPYTQVYTWVYQHQPGIRDYPAYSYFPGALFAEIPFYLLGNVRLGLALADIGTAILLYLIARPRLGMWPTRALTAFWLLFLPAFQVALNLGVLDFLLLFWITLTVWLYTRGHHVGSALAAAMVLTTKQYGFIFVVPWSLLFLRPLMTALLARWRGGRMRGADHAALRRLWLPPVAGLGLSALIMLPLAALSPNAFIDNTIFNHSATQLLPMLGTPQWNETIAAQLVALKWLSMHTAAMIASVVSTVTALTLIAIATVKVRDPASSLRWSATLGGLWFAFSHIQVQFFYWRLPLLLFLLAYIVGYPAAAHRIAPRAMHGEKTAAASVPPLTALPHD